MSSKINSLTKKVGLLEKLSVYGNRKDFLDKLAQDQSIYPGYEKPNMTSNPNAKPGPERIPTSVQTQLNELLVPSGKLVPIKVDGLLGPETRKAINLFRQEFNVPVGASDQEVFRQIQIAHGLPRTALFKKLDNFCKLSQMDASLPDGRSINRVLSGLVNQLTNSTNSSVRSVGLKLSNELQKQPVNYNNISPILFDLIRKGNEIGYKDLEGNFFEDLTDVYNALKTQKASESGRLIRPMDYRKMPKFVARLKNAVKFLDNPEKSEDQDLYSKIIFNLQGNQSADVLYQHIVEAMKKASDKWSKDTLKYLAEFMLENYSAGRSAPATISVPPEKPELQAVKPEDPIFQTLKTPGPIA